MAKSVTKNEQAATTESVTNGAQSSDETQAPVSENVAGNVVEETADIAVYITVHGPSPMPLSMASELVSVIRKKLNCVVQLHRASDFQVVAVPVTAKTKAGG